MGLSAVAALIASLALYGQRAWLTREQVKADKKAKPPVHETASQLHHKISQQQSGALIGTAVVVVALAVLGLSVYRGRHWSRWGVVAFWLLASFTGTVVGIGTVLSVGASVPAPFKAPAFTAGILLIIAVVLVNMKASTSWFALSRPVPAAGAPVRRGLFAPRTPAAGAGGRPSTRAAGRPGAAASARTKSVLTSNAATRGEAYLERQRAKKRATANADSIARGAELARSRAKASKSRRTDG
jgi:hypothetical protein